MKHTFFAAAVLLLTGCSIDIEETNPVIEQVFLQEEASIEGITCVLEGGYPHIKDLSSVQVEININAALDEFANTTKENVRDCPAQLVELTEDGAETRDITQVQYDVKLLNADVFSLTLLTSQMLEGAAHPNNSIDTFTFDLQSGQAIDLAEYFRDTPGYEEILEQAIVAALQREEMDIDRELRNPTEKFYLTESGLVLVDLFDVHALKGFEVRIPIIEPEPEPTT
jgi:hypothetical protein